MTMEYFIIDFREEFRDVDIAPEIFIFSPLLIKDGDRLPSFYVHVFTQEAHDYYDLEHLWADAAPVPASEWLEEKTETAE